MLTFQRLTESPLDPHERSVIARNKVLSKLNQDFGRIRHLFTIIDATLEDGVARIRTRVPSEPFLDKLFYDVIIELYIGDTGNKLTKKTQVKVFSNSPSFTFTYAYVYNKNGALIDKYKRNIGRRAMNEAPSRTNPKQIVGFEKSISFAMLGLRATGVLVDIKGFIEKFKPVIFLQRQKIMTNQQKLDEYNAVKQKNPVEYKAYTQRGRVGFFS